MRTIEQARISQSPNPFRPGSWEPGRFGLIDAIAIKITLLVVATVRGVDYVTVRTAPASAASESMRSAFPIEVWGALFLVPALLLGFGLAFRIHFSIWIGHGLLAAVYATLFVSLALVYLDRPLFDGIRTATELLVPLALHAILCVRTGWRPSRWESIDSNGMEAAIDHDG